MLLFFNHFIFFSFSLLYTWFWQKFLRILTYHVGHAKLYAEVLLCSSWSQQLVSLLLLHGVLARSCAWAGLFFSMYSVLFFYMPFFSTVAESFYSTVTVSNFYLPVTSLLAIFCRNLIIIGRKVVRIILWPLIFNLCCYGLGQHSFAGIVGNLSYFFNRYLVPPVQLVLTMTGIFQSIRSSSSTIRSEPSCEATTSEFCTIIIYRGGICLLFIEVCVVGATLMSFSA